MRKIIGLAVLSLVLTTLPSCVSSGGDSGGDTGGNNTADTTSSVDSDQASDSASVPMTTVVGKVTDDAGNGVDGIMILACDDDSCITTKTDGSGEFTVGVPVGWRKMQVMGTPKGFASMNFFQNVESADAPVQTGDIVVITASADPAVAFPAAEGGTAVLVGGALTVTAAAGVAVYPIGQTEEVTAVKVAAAHLPPYDMDAPWAGKEEATLAFHINPLPVKAASEEQSFGFTVTGGTGDYTVYYVNDHYGTLHEGDAVSADADGNVSGTVPVLTTLILVPAG
jgi:uncharacterized protein involved in high-affinity Fe2+ transport